MSPPGDHLSPAEAARLLHVSPRTVVRWIQEGRIPHELSERGEPRLRREDVLQLGGPPDGADADEDV